MTGLNQIYKCNICGNIVEMVHTGAGKLVCCGEPMELKKANSQDASIEKHVPVVEPGDNGIKVIIGSVPHPMEDKHYIEWVEVIAGGRVYRQNLNPGDEPVAEFPLPAHDIVVRAYCNLHGLWETIQNK